ncbi:hypothetical protein M0P65_02495 [Candidatus Gracilibacteria bacterium]|jgi:hypothetical protein|nr:hypothetical protein [Candidatus Gracilibacteria bacterium]
MKIARKYIVTCEKKEKSFLDKLLKRTKDFEVWNSCIVNNFTDSINTKIWRILSIKPTDEKMEVFGG